VNFPESSSTKVNDTQFIYLKEIEGDRTFPL